MWTNTRHLYKATMDEGEPLWALAVDIGEAANLVNGGDRRVVKIEHVAEQNMDLLIQRDEIRGGDIIWIKPEDMGCIPL